ncbi:PAS domain S-box-containing protein [Halobacillus dabanensis]|uniref:PAS domain S-box-containing protein n=1 Tax=Halobacillus dabanensis TaxID=240302 RepID=A0A1I3XTX7_HALDA|nr:PAS domain S-box protein [Halobacillus dabanensis]SFK22521.1 PAS domain S-box-containing protein [Halobacillus dabanensis]
MLLRNALDLLEEGVVITDEEFTITYVNPAYVKMFQLEQERIVGEKLNDIYPDLAPEKRILSKSVEQKENINYEGMDFHWRGKDMVLHISTKRFTYEGEDYTMIRIFDITEQAKREKQLINMIEEMTANIVTIAKGYALLPLQPILREEQRHILIEKVPVLCQEQKVDRLAIQFSGIASIDEEWADLLKDLMISLKLLGIEVVLAGMRPEVVMQFAQNHIRLDGVRTFMNIQQATKYFLETGLKPRFE